MHDARFCDHTVKCRETGITTLAIWIPSKSGVRLIYISRIRVGAAKNHLKAIHAARSDSAPPSPKKNAAGGEADISCRPDFPGCSADLRKG